jgi:hypothetical protein
VGGPAEAFLVAARKPNYFLFLWVAKDETGRFVQDAGAVLFGANDMVVSPMQGGLWIEEAMERTVIPLLNTQPRIAHSADEILKPPLGFCHYAPAWERVDPKPRHRPRIRPAWLRQTRRERG